MHELKTRRLFPFGLFATLSPSSWPLIITRHASYFAKLASHAQPEVCFATRVDDDTAAWRQLRRRADAKCISELH